MRNVSMTAHGVKEIIIGKKRKGKTYDGVEYLHQQIKIDDYVIDVFWDDDSPGLITLEGENE